MSGMKLRLGWAGSLFLLSALAVCCGSGIASATCTPTLPTAGSVPCYIKVQPIDVGTTVSGSVVFAPFNTTSQTGNPTTAGMPFAPNPITATSVPNNPASSNPIGFVVNPATGLFPGQAGYQGPGVDVTRALLNNLGVDLVWLGMNTVVTPGTQFPNNNFTTLNVVPTQASNTKVGSCTGFISGTTLTVNSCSPISTEGGNVASTLAVYDFLSSGTAILPNTFISALGTGSGGTGTYIVSTSQTAGSSKRPITITAFPGTLGSPDLLTLADQNPSPTPPNPPCSISQMTTPTLSAPCLTPPPSPLNSDPGTINLFFVNKLNPPAAGGTLYGFALIGNNGVAIGGNTFFAPTPLQARPDTIAHELMHNLGLKHETYGAGPYNPYNPTSNPFGGIAPPVLTANPFTGECDPNYPGCGANLMTSGDLRTEPTITCVLNGYNGATTPRCLGFPLGTTDQMTSTAQESSTSLPTSQQRAILAEGSGLLQTPPPIITSPTNLGGLIAPIPYETTTARLETGDSRTGRVTFDVSGPVDGKPGETLVGLVVSLPEDHTFAAQGGFDVVSQSRKDLVQDVTYYPNTGKDLLRKNIAYDPGSDNNADTPVVEAAVPSPCAATTSVCVMVKFQAPGLGRDDSFGFSERILRAGAPIAKDDLCKAKVTYVFSDGYRTTSNFGRCSPDPLSLIASSWRPDPHVAPQFIKSNLLLVQVAPPPSLACTPDPDIPGQCLYDPSQNPPEDADPTREGGQLGQSCNGGPPTGSTNVSGTIPGPNVTVTAGQRCNYTNCEFLGSLTINGGNVFLGNCQVDGNLTMSAGTLNLSASTQVIGNVQIANGSPVSLLPNSFMIGPGAQINGGLAIQSLPENEPGLVCGTTVSGGVSLKNNFSSIQIGTAAGQQMCTGNTIAGGLSCKNNTAVSGGGNTVSGGASGDCAGFTH